MGVLVWGVGGCVGECGESDRQVKQIERKANASERMEIT
eukprot:SAG11_NODE_2882_length_2871_cov_3.451659_1_plen_39_part_00